MRCSYFELNLQGLYCSHLRKEVSYQLLVQSNINIYFSIYMQTFLNKKTTFEYTNKHSYATSQKTSTLLSINLRRVANIPNIIYTLLCRIDIHETNCTPDEGWRMKYCVKNIKYTKKRFNYANNIQNVHF